MCKAIFSISKRFVLLLFVIIISLVGNCGKKHNLFQTEEIDFPPAPNNLRIFIGDGEAKLTWDIKEPQDISKYLIYRKDSLKADLNFLDSTYTKQFFDKDLTNGQFYSYQVSAVNIDLIEGPLSRSVNIIPNVYDIIIENGKEYTNNKIVTLTLTAPSTTQLMKISNDSLFVNSSWESFTSTKSWEFTGEDGIKSIYAKYRDKDGNEILEPATDNIVLDTEAIIYKLEENSNGQTLKNSDVLHVLLETNEKGGMAKFDIGSIRKGILLYDDGSHGDEKDNDGIYELDYRIPYGLEGENLKLAGYFTDLAGNVAESITTVSSITIEVSPKSVTLFKPVPIGNNYSSLNLTWSKSNDVDFSMYKLFRSKSAGVTLSSTLINTFENINAVQYNDENLQENSIYYYKVFVYDKSGLYNSSNEEFGKTNKNEPPSAVVLSSPSQSGEKTNSLILSWSQNVDLDFANYKIFRDTDSSIDSSSTLLATISDASITSYEASNLTEDKKYFFIVYVFDKGGRSSGSNTVIGTLTMQDPPKAVSLFPATNIKYNSVTLNWSQNYETNFASYRVFMSQNSYVDSTSKLDTTITNQNVTSFLSKDLDENTNYSFRVYVYNDKNKSAGSNIINVKTEIDSPPEVISLYEPEVKKTNISLSWAQAEEDDFSSYKIFRAKSQGVTTSSRLIKVISEKYNTLYTDSDLDDNTEYFYKVFVFDKGSNFTGSNEVSAITEEDEKPQKVDLFNPTEITQSEVELSWSANSDNDFASYRLFRSKNEGVTTTSKFVTIIIDRSATYYKDKGLEDSTEYYYRLFVYDNGGNFSESNEIKITTLKDRPPQSIILAQPTTMDSITLRISWSENKDNDFTSYQVFRSKSSPVDTTIAPITVINDQKTTYYSDTGLEMGVLYYYVIMVFDEKGLTSKSNEVSAKTR